MLINIKRNELNDYAKLLSKYGMVNSDIYEWECEFVTDFDLLPDSKGEVSIEELVELSEIKNPEKSIAMFVYALSTMGRLQSIFGDD